MHCENAYSVDGRCLVCLESQRHSQYKNFCFSLFLSPSLFPFPSSPSSPSHLLLPLTLPFSFFLFLPLRIPSLPLLLIFPSLSSTPFPSLSPSPTLFPSLPSPSSSLVFDPFYISCKWRLEDRFVLVLTKIWILTSWAEKLSLMLLKDFWVRHQFRGADLHFPTIPACNRDFLCFLSLQDSEVKEEESWSANYRKPSLCSQYQWVYSRGIIK